MAEYSYNPNRSAEWNYGGAKWKLSRSKIDFFFECPRCFYLDNVLGTKRPSFPSFNLNIAVDELFKKNLMYTVKIRLRTRFSTNTISTLFRLNTRKWMSGVTPLSALPTPISQPG